MSIAIKGFFGVDDIKDEIICDHPPGAQPISIARWPFFNILNLFWISRSLNAALDL
jgi:hypothetical protein